MNLALWIVQGILAFAFIVVGFLKLFAYEKYKALTEKNGPTGMTRGLAAFIGIAELAGGVGIILPMAANMAPWLSLWAAIGLLAIMLLAIGFHLRRRESSVRPAVLFLMAMFVVYGRLTLLKQ
jgi:putative oxidoreductase